YLGTTAYNAPQIAEILELPERVVPVITVAVGYPAGESEKSDRIPVEGFIHEEIYKDYSPERIKDIYCEKEAREDSRKFIKENNKETLAQVFTDVRYPKETNEIFSKIYKDFISKQGFNIDGE
ncbi:MAG: NADPH-dependent oxidoreductase, partial [Muribaculaceae bacterium]|nr:NADPH-dependent oxidoreductase [Muribaculaceae bacterium]